MPAVLGCREQLRKTKEEGYLTCPFDLCVSNYEYIDNDEAEEIDLALDILYKQLFEEGDR